MLLQSSSVIAIMIIRLSTTRRSRPSVSPSDGCKVRPRTVGGEHYRYPKSTKSYFFHFLKRADSGTIGVISGSALRPSLDDGKLLPQMVALLCLFARSDRSLAFFYIIPPCLEVGELLGTFLRRGDPQWFFLVFVEV